MILSPEQTRALDAIAHWRSTPSRSFFILSGYAGTGKTTLLQEFINAQSHSVICLAPTGKAASVLGKKLTNARVSTVHKALYQPVSPSTERLEALEAALINHPDNEEVKQALEEEKERLAKRGIKFDLKADATISNGDLVIVDEASMVTERMHVDLIATGANILYVGDAGQLPPVMDGGFFAHHRPDVTLEQVHRQALESDIIRVSMQIRNGDSIDVTWGGEYDEESNTQFQKVWKDGMRYDSWLTFDQVITGRNESRQRINRYFRTKANRKGWWPEDSEKLICLKNETDAGNIFINGVQGTALNNFQFVAELGELAGDVLYDGVVIPCQPFYRYPFQSHYDPQAIEEPYHNRRGSREFDYAYAITVHKSQGSEWDRVLIADDQMQSQNREFRKRWLYTAVTRARKELVWLI